MFTGYLGGTIASDLRLGIPPFTPVLFPVDVALLLRGGLYLQEARHRVLLPWRRDAPLYDPSKK